jgi:hypothetical protein
MPDPKYWPTNNPSPKSLEPRRKGKAGRPKGAKNKLTGAQQDLLHAWDEVSGPVTSKRLMKAAIEDGLGREIPIINKEGDVVGQRIVRDWEALRTILPYIARKMPDTVELKKIADLSPEEAIAAAKHVIENLGEEE